MKLTKLAHAALSLLLLTGLTGCFQTKVHSPQASRSGQTHQDRQWFTLGGLIGISSPAGSECGTAGVARSESKFGGTDILIDVGLSIVGGVLGTAACNSISDRGDYAACLSAFSTAVPLLLTPLSVEYECAAEPARDVASTPARNHTWTSKTQTAQAALPEIPTPLAEVPSPEVASPLLVNATAPGQ